MAYDVFVSYASKDKNVADAACAKLEASRIRCWIAPRDVFPGQDYGDSIIRAIDQCRICVLIFSAHANVSEHVKNEVEQIISKGKPVLPIRVDNVNPSGSLALHLSRRHWLDALTPPLEKHLERLCEVVQMLLNSMKDDQPGIQDKKQSSADSTVGTRIKEKSHEYKEPRDSSMRNVIIAGIGLIAIAVFVLLYAFWNGKQARDSKTYTIQKEKPDEGKEASSKRIDALVASLAAKYKEGKFQTAETVSDEWTSRPLTMVFMDIQSIGTTEANKENFVSSLIMSLQKENRVNMVEREILLKLLQELYLSSSDLADPITRMKIGKVFSAQVIVTGKIISEGREDIAILRFVDTETTAVKKVLSAEYSSGNMRTDLEELKRKIITWVNTDYPLKGRIISISGDRCQINLGQIHGLRKGDRLGVVNEIPNGSGVYSSAGEIEINEVGHDTSWGLINQSINPVQKNMKVKWKR
jgi:hypothetical protein